MKIAICILLLVSLLVPVAGMASGDQTDEMFLEYSYQLFGENGNYHEWPLDAKLRWLNALSTVSETEHAIAIRTLIQQANETEIDAYLANRYGMEGHPEVISVHYVLEEAWGSSYFWTIEQRAQQTIWIETYMPNEMWDVYHHVIPTSNVISPEEATQIATETVVSADIIDPNVAVDFAVQYGVPRTALADMPCHYVIDFYETRIVDGEERKIPVFSCFVTNEGEVMDSSYDRALSFSEVKPSNFPQLPYESFSAWSLEEKADFSETYYEDMKEYMAVYPNYRGVYYYATRYRYGLPDENSIPQEKAEQLAREAALTVGANENELSRAGARVYYDITNAEQPVWKVYLSTLFSQSTTYGDAIGYFVILNANTGDVVDAYQHESGMQLELFY